MPAGGKAAPEWQTRLEAAGWRLPPPPAPLGDYSPAVEAGGLLFLSGMLPLRDGTFLSTGRVGAEVTFDEGRNAAVQSVLNGLAIALAALDEPERLARAVRLGVNIAATEDFTRHPALADAASAVLNAAFPGSPSHTRLVSGARSLANGSPVVVELIFALEAPGQ